MKNAAVKFALFALGASVIWIFFEHMMGWNTTNHYIGQYSRMLPMILFWIMLVVCIWYVRRNHGNTLTFREGFESGLVMTLIYCVGFTLVIFLYSKFMNPTMHETMTAFTQQEFKDGQLNQQQLDDALKEIDTVYSGKPLSYLLLFIFSAIWGIGISAIASGLLRKKV
jgi:hypothetical protein